MSILKSTKGVKKSSELRWKENFRSIGILFFFFFFDHYQKSHHGIAQLLALKAKKGPFPTCTFTEIVIDK